MAKKFKEELNTKMHSEFIVSMDTDKKHRVFSAIRTMDDLNYTTDQVEKLFNVTEADIKQFRSDYKALLS